MERENNIIRVVNTIEKEEFIRLLPSLGKGAWLSEKESVLLSFPNNIRSLAGRYLIKKAICDHLDKDSNKSEIEILNTESGKPEVILSGKILGAYKTAGIKKICCSISHSRNFIAGMTIFCY